MLKFLCNNYDPQQPDARYKVISETPDEAWENEQQWLKDKIIGEPKATETFTVDELKAMHYVGIYMEEE